MMRSAVVLLALCACTRGSPFFAGSPPPPPVPPDAGVADSPPVPPPGGGVAGSGPTFAGCPMFPASDAWNTDISAVPADPHSADYLAFMGAGSLTLWPGFGGPYGQPVTIVPGTQPRVPMSFLYASQSEPGPYPFPSDVGIEAGDRHATVLDKGGCKIYETYNTFASGAGFHADSGAVFDLITGAPRPDGWTSATAAGLPILPGLARYDEVVEQGEVRHAFAFIAGGTAHKYVAPATHSSGTSTAQFAPPMGLRMRLRADFDLSRFQGPSLVILRALQKYGMFVTDNGSGQFWALAGAQDSRWPVAELEPLKTVPASAFEVVQLGTVHTGQ